MGQIAVVVSVPEGATAEVTKYDTESEVMDGFPITLNGGSALQYTIEDGEDIKVSNTSEA